MDSVNITRFLRQPAVFGVLQGLILFASIVVVREAGVLQPVELEAYDLFLRFRQSEADIEPRVALIAVTEADIQRLGQWPLPDDTLATLIEDLETHDPDVIGLDIYRDLPLPPGTERLEHVLTGNSNIIMVQKFGDAASSGVPPPAVLSGTAQVGFSDLLVDPDGVVRRGLLFLDDGVDTVFSLPLRLALHYLQSRGIQPRPGKSDPSWLRLGEVSLRPFEASDGGYVDADARGYQYLLDYHGGPRPFPVYTLGALLDGHIPPNALRGRVVVVGVEADSVKDDFVTPFRHVGDDAPGVPGSVIHAHATSQLLRAALDGDRPMAVIYDVLEYAWILLWTAAGVVVVLFFKSVGKFIPVAVFGTLLLLMISWLAFVNGLWLPLVPAAIGWISTAALMTAYLSSYESAQRRQIMELFSRQVSEDVANEIWEQREHFLAGGRLAAREVKATVLFSDLENFTPVSEKLGPVRLMEWLNRHMEIMAGLVFEYGGIIDDYYGDAIMADFGVPLQRTTEEEFTEDARRAVDCALAMRAAIAQHNIENEERSLPPVRMRVGICTGDMVVGFLGTAQRMKYTTIGDTVNTAARLESYGKELPPMDPREGACRILISESTATRLDDRYEIESVGQLALKGKSEAVNVFKVVTCSGVTVQDT